MKSKIFDIDVVFIILVVAALAVGTYERNRTWLSGLTLWQDVVKKSPNKPRPHNNLGTELMRLKRLPEAKGSFETAIRLEGNRPPYQQSILMEAYSNLGVILGEAKQYAEAFDCFERALVFNRTSHEVWNNYALYQWNSGNHEMAVRYFREALKLKPDSELIRTNFKRVMAARMKKEMQ